MVFHRPFRPRGLGTSKFYFLLFIVVIGTLQWTRSVKWMEAQAKFAFAASQEDELSFEKGSILNVST